MTYDSIMYLLTEDYKTHSEHNFLLLISLLLVTLATYGVIKSSKYITISPMVYTSLKVQEKIVSIVITPTPIIKEQVTKVIKPVKKIVKKEVIKKLIPVKSKPVLKPIAEPVIQKTELVKIAPKPIAIQQIPLPLVPTPDVKMKASFIAGLYELLNEKKFYPKMAKRRKLEGIVHISFTLNKDGTIKHIFLKEGCGHTILDKAALKVVKSINSYIAIPDAVSMTSLNINIPIKYSRS